MSHWQTPQNIVFEPYVLTYQTRAWLCWSVLDAFTCGWSYCWNLADNGWTEKTRTHEVSHTMRESVCIHVFHSFHLFVRSVGVSNFNVNHLEKLLEATPDNIPSGVCVCVCVCHYATPDNIPSGVCVCVFIMSIIYTLHKLLVFICHYSKPNWVKSLPHTWKRHYILQGQGYCCWSILSIDKRTKTQRSQISVYCSEVINPYL